MYRLPGVHWVPKEGFCLLCFGGISPRCPCIGGTSPNSCRKQAGFDSNWLYMGYGFLSEHRDQAWWSSLVVMMIIIVVVIMIHAMANLSFDVKVVSLMIKYFFDHQRYNFFWSSTIQHHHRWWKFINYFSDIIAAIMRCWPLNVLFLIVLVW